MKKIVNLVLGAIFPKAEAKASPVKGRCIPGCGGDKVYLASGYVPAIGEKLPCC